MAQGAFHFGENYAAQAHYQIFAVACVHSGPQVRRSGSYRRPGGQEASTDGNVISLPDLPLDCDDTLLGLIRGYIDHGATCC